MSTFEKPNLKIKKKKTSKYANSASNKIFNTSIHLSSFSLTLLLLLKVYSFGMLFSTSVQLFFALTTNLIN